MNELAPALSGALLRFLWQGALAAAGCAVVLALLRRRSANARYLTACCGLAVMAAIPVVDTVAALNRPSQTAAPVISNVTPSPAPAPSGRAPGVALDGIENWTLRIWAVGVVLFGLRLAVSYGHVARLRRTGEAAGAELVARVSELAGRMGVLRPVTLLISRMADSPSVTGWLRPAILMPVAVLAGLDAAQLEAILAHELAHIRRHDYLVNLLQTVVETLLFYHPAVWWLSARIRRERECCCDDLAVRHCGGALGYARSLASLERLRVAPVLTPAANGDSLLFRIRRLMGEQEAAPSKAPVVAAALVAALCVVANVHWAHAQTRNTANVASRAPLEYPDAARAKGIEGTVTAEVTLDGQGNVTDARIVSGPVELRKAALGSVLDWRFANAAAGEVRQVPIEFRKDMPSTHSEPGFLFVGDELNERLMHLVEQRTELERQLATAREQIDQAQGQAADTQQRRNRVAETEAEMKALQAQLAVEVQRQAEQLNEARGQAGEAQKQQLARLGTTDAEMKALQAQLSAEQQRLAEQQRGIAHRPDSSFNGQDYAFDDGRIATVEGYWQAAAQRVAAMQKMYGPNSPRLKEALAVRDSLAKQLEELRHAEGMHGTVRFIEVSGRHIVRIQVSPAEGAPNETPADLPVHVGDEWNSESTTKVQKWALSKSANPSYQFTIGSNGDIELLILLR